MRSRVDLPAPERPITPTKRPRLDLQRDLSTASLAPKRRDTFSMTSMDQPSRARDRYWLFATVA